MKLFFDASAFVKRYVSEPGSEEVVSLCNGADDIAMSILCPVEIVSAVSRLHREGRVSARQYAGIKARMLSDIRDITLVAIEATVVRNAISALESSPLKTLDSLHVACAMQWKPDCFVSSDILQIAAAKKIGLKVRQV
jgi:predicted nucleic acid-binding protein